MATGRNTLIFMLSGIALDIVILTKLTPKLAAYSNGMKPSDLLFGFSSDSMIRLFDALGKAGRSYYLCAFHGIDYVFTIVMGIGITLLMIYPNRVEVLSVIASAGNILKNVFFMISFLAVVILSVRLIITSLLNRLKQ